MVLYQGTTSRLAKTFAFVSGHELVYSCRKSPKRNRASAPAPLNGQLFKSRVRLQNPEPPPNPPSQPYRVRARLESCRKRRKRIRALAPAAWPRSNDVKTPGAVRTNSTALSSTVTHSPELAWTPSYVGSTQPRPFRLEGNPAHHHRNPRSRRSGDPEAGAGLGAAEINPLAQSF